VPFPQENNVRVVGYKSTQQLMNEVVCKSGRTTNYSCFTTTMIHVTLTYNGVTILDGVRAHSDQTPDAISER